MRGLFVWRISERITPKPFVYLAGAAFTLPPSTQRAYCMDKKREYVYQLMLLHEEKTGEVLTEDQALEHFEQLVALVEAVYE